LTQGLLSFKEALVDHGSAEDLAASELAYLAEIGAHWLSDGI
jgi:hypothetical protein